MYKHTQQLGVLYTLLHEVWRHHSWMRSICYSLNTMRPRQNGRHFQTTFSNGFCWMKLYEFRLKFHWSLFLGVQLTIFQHWCRKWLGANQATNHYLHQWWLIHWRIYASLGLNELQYIPRNMHMYGFVVLCFVVVKQSFIMNSHEVFIHIHQGYFAGTGAIVRLPQCQWSKPDGYGKISQCITTRKHSKAKTVCIFLGIYCKHAYLHPWYWFSFIRIYVWMSIILLNLDMTLLDIQSPFFYHYIYIHIKEHFGIHIIV